MKQWEMGRSQTPLPPERRAEVPWLFIRQQTGPACWCAAPYRHPAAHYPRTTKPRSSRRACGWHDCTRAVICLPARLGSGPGQIADQSRSAQSPDGYRRRLRGIGCFRCECAERMSETATLEFIVRRLDGLQNNVSGLNRRMITLESNLIDRVGALEARMAGLEDRVDQLVDRIGALATGVNSLVLLG